MSGRPPAPDPDIPALRPAPDGTRIAIRVQPRASRTEIAGLHGDAVRIRLAAPPVDGAANEALVRFLAERLGVPRSAIVLLAGHAGRTKTVVVRGLTPIQTQRALGLAYPPASEATGHSLPLARSRPAFIFQEIIRSPW